MKRIWCLLFHWTRRRYPKDAINFHLGYQCGHCGERWGALREMNIGAEFIEDDLQRWKIR